MGRACCISQVDKEGPQKKEKKVTIEGHLQGSEWGHNQLERNAKVVGIKRRSDE
jgi:hypothetical protein